MSSYQPWEKEYWIGRLCYKFMSPKTYLLTDLSPITKEGEKLEFPQRVAQLVSDGTFNGFKVEFLVDKIKVHFSNRNDAEFFCSKLAIYCAFHRKNSASLLSL